MTKLIVNADDFGYCKAVNYGIIDAHKNGIITSTTMMANMPAVEHGVKLLKYTDTLSCGVHLTMSCYKPLLGNHKTIVDENGNFYKRITDEVLGKMDLEEIYNEFCAQIEKIKSLGIDICHIDSHHHVHTLKGLQPVIEKILKEYNLPIRGGFEYNLEYNNVVPLIDSFYNENVSEDYFINNLECIQKYDFVDLMCHPAYLDDFILNSTSYAIARTKEFKILTSKNINKFLESNNIELSNYKDI
ncbi:MAG: chitin disaccharide deacetylase [Peptostreptococcaceae bacterium]